MHLDPDRLTLLAFGGEPVDADDAAHLAFCTECREEYESLRQLVGRGPDPNTDELSSSPRVWDTIMRQILAESPMLSADQAAALASDSAGRPSPGPLVPAASFVGSSSRDRSNGHHPVSPAGPRVTTRPSARDPWVLRAAGLAIAAAVIAVAGTLGIIAVRDSDGGTIMARAQLAATPDAPAGAAGSADLVRVAEGTQLRLTLSGMPAPGGYYEAWLVDPSTGSMYPMGPITSRGGTVMVAGVDLTRYTGVDVSAQPVDAGSGHGDRLLWGTLR